MATEDEIQARRSARKAAQRDEQQAQRCLDLEALDALEQEHGDTSVKAIEIPYTPGLPTMVICKAAYAIALQRYRDSVKAQGDGRTPDYVKAGEQLASLCVVYPDADTYAKVREARPGVHLQLGMAALELATGRAQAEGKS